MYRLIADRLAGTREPAEPESEALRRLPEGVAERWFSVPLRQAAVLLPLVDVDGQPELLFTVRTDDLPSHPGQISFPGGRREAHDINLSATALRETEEETGIVSGSVAVLGYLPPLAVISGFAVTPVVGQVEGEYQLTPDPAEVAEVFSVPLEFLLDEANEEPVWRDYKGTRTRMWEYHYRDYRIWGATAQILNSFLTVIKQ